MAFEWFRSWHGAPTDPKWLLIARNAQVPPGVVSAVAWALLDHASQHADRGSVDGFDVETYAAWAGWEEADVIAVIAAMHSKGIITPNNRLSNWEKRQPKREDPTGNERQRNWRNRHRDDGVTTEDVTQRNASVTQDNAKSRLDQIRSDQNDDEKAQAIQALQEFGLFNQPMLAQFNDMWPELTGRRDWVGKAITIARDKGASSPQYPLKVLANAIHTGKEPGYVNGTGDPVSKPRPSYNNPVALEKSRRIEEAARALAAEGITQDTDHLWILKIDDWIEAKYGECP